MCHLKASVVSKMTHRARNYVKKPNPVATKPSPGLSSV